MINGIIVVDKQPGFTSHDVVAKLRGICGQKKIGHTGTLDPAATGVLPVCLGSGTKLCGMLNEKDKEYVAELRLGVETDTQDMTGQVLATHTVEADEDTVRRVCLGFEGDYAQIPPMYSALKVNGKKLYELARAGKEVERRARPVIIHELEILSMELPLVRMRVVCSKGTYIRTLCHDIGRKLGCGGSMQSLRRTRVGVFGQDGAVTLEELQRLKDEGSLRSRVIPVDRMFADCPALHVSAQYAATLENGNPIDFSRMQESAEYGHGQWVRVYRQDGSFAAVYAADCEREMYRPVKMFLERERVPWRL